MFIKFNDFVGFRTRDLLSSVNYHNHYGIFLQYFYTYAMNMSDVSKGEYKTCDSNKGDNKGGATGHRFPFALLRPIALSSM
jgi:hypothetical protein